MSFTESPRSAVITDAVGNTINLGNASGSFTAAPQSIVLTDASGHTLIVGAGVVGKDDQTAQQANVGTTVLYTVPAASAGLYLVTAYIVRTQAATTSSTLPSVNVSWTDDSSVGQVNNNITLTNTTNTVGSYGTDTGGGFPPASRAIYAKAGSVIQYSTQGYASSGATPMQYAVHIRVSLIG